MIYAVTAVCLAYMLALLIMTTIRLCTKQRAQRLAYIRGFKRGKFALIFIAALPLYLLAHLDNGSGVGEAILRAVRSCIDLVVLKFDVDSVYSLMQSNTFYAISLYFCFTLVTLNAVVLTFALFGQKLFNAYACRRVFAAPKTFVVVGDSEQNNSIIKSITDCDGKVLYITNDATAAADFSYINKKPYLPLNNRDLGALLKKCFRRFDNKAVNVIINNNDDTTNLVLLEQLYTIIEEQQLTQLSLDEKRGLNCYVFGDTGAASAYLRFVERAKGCIHYLNKYRLIAMDFIERYPITHFMTAKQIDYATATLRAECNVNVFVLGFGKLGRTLFLTSVANHQFLTRIDGKLCAKPINYFIYDRLNSKSDKNLNHNYFRYRNECLSLDNTGDYLPLPAMPANEQFYELDVNDEKFYNSLRNNLSGKGNNFNYVVISFGTDIENLDFAEKLTSKLKEWELTHSTKVFVKIRNGTLCRQVVQRCYCGDGLLYTFGNEDEVVYNLRQIVAERQEMMARDRHFCYKLKSHVAAEEEEQIKASALAQWYAWHEVQRESNVYACLSIRMKLNLLGYDYAPIGSPLEDASQSFMAAYTAKDSIVYDDKLGTVKGKRTVKYTNNYVEGSIRQTYAVQEHQRWNAYMITSGIIPSTLTQLANEGAKNLALRRHSNITTFEGLTEFRRITAKLNNCSEEDTDVIRYDYQLMDDVVWLLGRNGFKIVKRND